MNSITILIYLVFVVFGDTCPPGIISGYPGTNMDNKCYCGGGSGDYCWNGLYCVGSECVYDEACTNEGVQPLLCLCGGESCTLFDGRTCTNDVCDYPACPSGEKTTVQSTCYCGGDYCGPGKICDLTIGNNNDNKCTTEDCPASGVVLSNSCVCGSDTCSPGYICNPAIGYKCTLPECSTDGSVATGYCGCGDKKCEPGQICDSAAGNQCRYPDCVGTGIQDSTCKCYDKECSPGQTCTQDASSGACNYPDCPFTTTSAVDAFCKCGSFNCSRFKSDSCTNEVCTCGTGGSCDYPQYYCSSGTCVPSEPCRACTGLSNSDGCVKGVCKCGTGAACSGETPVCSSSACIAVSDGGSIVCVPALLIVLVLVFLVQGF